MKLFKKILRYRKKKQNRKKLYNKVRTFLEQAFNEFIDRSQSPENNDIPDCLDKIPRYDHTDGSKLRQIMILYKYTRYDVITGCPIIKHRVTFGLVNWKKYHLNSEYIFQPVSWATQITLSEDEYYQITLDKMKIQTIIEMLKESQYYKNCCLHENGSIITN